MFHRYNEKKVKTERSKPETKTKETERSKTISKTKESERSKKESGRSKTDHKTKEDTKKEEKKESKLPKEKEEEKKEVKKEDKKEKNSVIHVKSVDEYEKLKSDGLVVIDYYTEWCGPCKNFAPTFEKLAKNYTGVTFLSVDAEKLDHPDCETINKVPSFKVFLNGNLKREFTGADEEKLAKYIERYEIQILVYGKVQKSFNHKLKEYITEYMDMLTPDV